MREDWQIVKLGDVLKLEYGKGLSKADRVEEDGYPAYGANGIKCRSKNYLFDKPSIIVGRKGSAGELTLTDGGFWPLDVTYYVTFDDTQYDLLYLYYGLKLLELPRLAKGVKPGINRNDVYAQIIPLPPLPEQERIVSILDKAFEGIDKAIAQTEQNLASARELFESYLNNIFTQKGEDWQTFPIKDVASVVSGGTPKSKVSEYWDGSVRWITPKDMGKLKSSYVSETSRTISDLGLDKSSAKLFPAYSVILSTRAPIGHLAINTVAMATNQGCRALIPNDSVNTEFLFYFLKTSVSLLNEIGTGATFKELAKSKLEEVQIPLPPFTEQERIVSILDKLKLSSHNLQALYIQKLNDLKELKQSLLQQAFAGELTKEDAA